MFQEFTQLNNSERDRQRGLGLGLTIVRQLCALMDIDLRLESAVNKGTTITLVLQRTAEVIDAEREETGTPMLSGRVVLVIDDERDIRDGMVRVLGQAGARVVAAQSVSAAIDALHQAELVPECIVADFRLRDDFNGVQAVAQICLLYTSDAADDW